MGYVDVDALRNMWTFMFGVMFFLIVVIVGLVIWIVSLNKKVRALNKIGETK
jgi:flagellar biogenesis protein FliO